ncbi:MAG TPA: DUF433 domain-containing protein [Leptospiraceae bacterium]|nr:DUF433 domain-containing protein [Leptospiraceae bacterium]HMW06481.1 DUF433 domain-containing protein [Leptospiraceae bacterium]HMX32417.1 DUF433 domain-containing protein [Leptospiraceae bacterium]HMY33660.1 DUF433 domain-containing protein [Leptospiraceae bacterium]HMZ65211.1 DUF433 domain-containing protein [Leptospiraceae bacterium]
MDVKEYITRDPKIMFGKPVIKGTRIPVDLILEKLALGETIEQLLLAYPKINQVSINACLLYASLLIKNEVVYSAA